MSEVVDLQRAIRKQVDDIMENLGAYKELLAGAFAQATNLDPRDCQIIQQTMCDGSVRVWYEARTTQDKEDRIASQNQYIDLLLGRIKELEDEIKRAYQDGFTDGYTFFPDLGHGKVVDE